ncbi:sensor histidine kinase [Streptosporangium sp. 'caverna']|uniref:sensor histidine kinase n=1 Tax=Streptosporangium sp. 'caverna' TaxID=2202249 RepID=UPI000D7E19C9|nr:histidine kinase [Streptosporangium sp. 'caverna']AWS44773.1 hypothetical protein DKM19_29070 [Streptosporangium sp. 'caverna']
MRDRTVRVLKSGLYQLLGAALLTPVAAGLALLFLTDPSLTRILLLWAACLPASVLVTSVPLVQRIEVIALSELLQVDVPERVDRLYLWILTTLHLFLGATLSAVALVLLPGVVQVVDIGQWQEDPAPVVQFLAVLVGAVAVMVAAGVAQRWAVRRMLRSDPSHTIEDLDRRQTLALELHDSVGHALSVVLVQGMAAQAVLQGRDDGDEVARSLDHLVTTARDAQQDLDVLLGVLDDADAVGAPTLLSLGKLTRGLEVECHVDPVDKVPEHTSRVAYAIAREAVTNALRHGRGRVRMHVAVGSDLVLSVENEAAGTPSVSPSREGRGLVGMRMRARLVGGTCEWREVDSTWGVRATLPLRAK